MKTRLIIFTGIFFAFLCQAQISLVNIKIPVQQRIVFTSKTSLYSFDGNAFYHYKKNPAGPNFLTFLCDTIRWDQQYLSPTLFDPFVNTESCQFTDSLHGMIFRPFKDKTGHTALLKTSDGGYTWQLRSDIQDTSKMYGGSLAMKDFDNFLYQSKNVYHLRNRVYNKIDIDSQSTYKMIYKEGIYGITDIYKKLTYISKDDGQTWGKYIIPSDTGVKGYIYFQKQHIISGKLYVFHITTPYSALEISALSYVTVIDPYTGKVEQHAYNKNFEDMYFDHSGNMYLTRQTYAASHYIYEIYRVNGKTLIKTSSFKIDARVGHSDQGQNQNIIHFNDSTVFMFDHPDCAKLAKSRVIVSSDSVDIFPITSGSIDPISYPHALTLDATNGDTISDNCCWYNYQSSYEGFKWYGKKIRQPKSDSLYLLIKTLDDPYSKCVIKIQWDQKIVLAVEETPLAISQISMFPNPATDYLDFANLKPGSVLEVADFTGQVLLKHIYIENEKLDIRSLKAGSYSIKIMSDKKTTNRLIFIKN
ncbi:MAG: T9SS type A sorting domain-containing protein [Opitutaceae bacterium]|nr:T9SS type A sorting domain-containing protein [Cytophagales bacterium]